ncbi:MAG: EamA family transporter RarD [Parvularculaceae bacterium]
MKARTGGAPSSEGVRAGLLAGIAAYAIWGLFPLYLKQIETVPALEVVAHRIVWSLPFGALVLTVLKQWREVTAAFARPHVVARLALAATLIAVNWLVYVWCVANDRVLQASLGYYINPLIFIATGVVVLRENLNRLQIAAVILAAIGVLVLTIGAGVFPWPSFVLALSFTTYGYVRKTTPVGAMPGLFIEVALLAPLAAGYLLFLWSGGGGAFASEGTTIDLFLAAAGPATVIPLALFALAARRLRLSTLGFLQYIGPTGQLLLGLYYGEEFTAAHGVCFALIWSALALISFDAVQRNRHETREAAIIQSAAASPNNS